MSGHSAKKSGDMMLSVNFNLGNNNAAGDGQQQYDIPTLKRLNPELYKEYAKS